MLKSGHPHHNRALSLGVLIAVALAAAPASAPALAQGAHGRDAPAQAPAEALSPKQKAARRWPQPVRVGDLADRQVLEPSNHQGVLGRVAGVARTGDGDIKLIVRYGGVLGVGTRPIAVPVEATTLLGPFVQIVDLDKAQLSALPTYDGAGTTPLGPDEVIRIGINRN